MSNPFRGGDANKSREEHRFSDVDTGPLAQHHTLGNGPHQAARGNHDHDADYSPVGHTHPYSPDTHNHDAAYAPVSHGAHIEVTNYTPTLTNFAGIVSTGRQIRIGDLVTITGRILLTGVPTGTMRISLPFPMLTLYLDDQVLGYAYARDVGTSRYAGVAVPDNTDTDPNFVQFLGPTTVGFWNAATPFTWAVNDILSYNVTYLRQV